MIGYSWVTDEMFDTAILEILEGMAAEEIIRMPGVYELVVEGLNNAALELLESRRKPIEQGGRDA